MQSELLLKSLNLKEMWILVYSIPALNPGLQIAHTACYADSFQNLRFWPVNTLAHYALKGAMHFCFASAPLFIYPGPINTTNIFILKFISYL